MVIGLALRKKVINTLGLLVVGLLTALYAGRLPADTTASLLIGTAWTADSDVRYSPNDATNLTYEGVSWDTDPFGTPPYYAFRLTHWLDRVPHWGMAFDFTHAKMISDANRIVRVVGYRDGARINDVERADVGGTRYGSGWRGISEHGCADASSELRDRV